MWIYNTLASPSKGLFPIQALLLRQEEWSTFGTDFFDRCEFKEDFLAIFFANKKRMSSVNFVWEWKFSYASNGFKTLRRLELNWFSLGFVVNLTIGMLPVFSMMSWVARAAVHQFCKWGRFQTTIAEEPTRTWLATSTEHIWGSLKLWK